MKGRRKALAGLAGAAGTLLLRPGIAWPQAPKSTPRIGFLVFSKSSVPFTVEPFREGTPYYNERKRIADLAAKARMPVQTYARELVDAGMLMSYGPSFTGMARRAAYFLDRILKGAKPADLPVEAPTRYEMVVNLKTAAAIGVRFTPTFMLRADEVIE